MCRNCRSEPCFKRLFVKSPLKIRKNFVPTTLLHFGEAFEVPRDFSRKVPCVGAWGGQPQHSTLTQKARRCRAFPLSIIQGKLCVFQRYKYYRDKYDLEYYSGNSVCDDSRPESGKTEFGTVYPSHYKFHTAPYKTPECH